MATDEIEFYCASWSDSINANIGGEVYASFDAVEPARKTDAIFGMVF